MGAVADPCFLCCPLLTQRIFYQIKMLEITAANGVVLSVPQVVNVTRGITTVLRYDNTVTYTWPAPKELSWNQEMYKTTNIFQGE